LGTDEYGDFSRFGEVASLAERAGMTDEALEIVSAVWAGQPYVHSGSHYRVDLPATFPEPHAIPVWVAGTMPAVKAAGRAARHDGIVLLGPDRVPAVEDVRRAVSLVGRGPEFDVVLAGNASLAWGGDDVMTDIGPLSGAGMTWWAESLIHFDSLELTLKVVDAGPSALLGF
jgi:alkanesulfonate monooxygenase SsuD/methylene tetrahydromethanopterin reductase-like flavin-dependent oxidoreductase (luciferase family)